MQFCIKLTRFAKKNFITKRANLVQNRGQNRGQNRANVNAPLRIDIPSDDNTL
jgi:hypothetical protein